MEQSQNVVKTYIYIERERERERERRTDRQTDRQAGRQTDRDRQTDRQSKNIEIYFGLRESPLRL